MVEAEGLTVIELPVPMEVPPQLPSYHFHEAFAPNVPPETASVTLAPAHRESLVEVIANAATERLFTLIVRLTHILLLQAPSARTKYVVVTVGLTVIEEPVPIEVPPHDPVYHFQTEPLASLPPFTLSKMLFPEQIESLTAEIDIAGSDVSLTIIRLETHAVIFMEPSART
jgi:hypothetical protein